MDFSVGVIKPVTSQYIQILYHDFKEKKEIKWIKRCSPSCAQILLPKAQKPSCAHFQSLKNDLCMTALQVSALISFSLCVLQFCLQARF